MISKPLRIADAVLAGLIVAGYGFFAFRQAFHFLEWYDWIAYALPAANFVERGSVSLPQLGSQYHFDQYWLFNAPLMGVGPVPFFAAFGVGRVSYLIGIVVAAVVNLAVFTWVIRRAMQLPSMALAALCTWAFLGNRNYNSILYMQRYDAIVLSVMLLAFVPLKTSRGGAPAWRWLCAGVLPLLHPSLIPASVAWLVTEVALAFVSGRHRAAPPEPRRYFGPALFALTGIAALAWYGRIDAFQNQFLPHIRYHANRLAYAPDVGKIFDVPIGMPYKLASLATTLIIVVAAFGLLASTIRRSPQRPPIRVAVAALLIALTVALDLVRGQRYWVFFILGLGPCLLFAGCDQGGRRKIVLSLLIGLAVIQTAMSLKLDRLSVLSTDQRDSVGFVVVHTRPAERIVLGPPFILAAAPAHLTEQREVVRVVPQPFYLADFDPVAFRAEIQKMATVYVGEREWFYRPEIVTKNQRAQIPLFPDAAIEEFTFSGTRVIVARAKGVSNH
jgi:hypothetical protein